MAVSSTGSASRLDTGISARVRYNEHRLTLRVSDGAGRASLPHASQLISWLNSVSSGLWR